MNKIKRAIVSIILISVATAFMISVTFIENLDKVTRIIIALIYTAIMTVTTVTNIIFAFKNKK
jgi:uncharacterized protein YlxP (DUF503 family)